MDPFTIIMSVLGMANQANATQQAKNLAENMRMSGQNLMFESIIDKKRLGEPPKMNVPASVDEFIGLKKTMARQQMPGYDKQKALIDQSSAATLSGISQVGQGASAEVGVLAAGADRLRALRQLGITASQYRAGQQENYAQAVASRAPWEQQMFETNQMYPWQVGMNEVMGKYNAGLQMMMGGADMGVGANIQGANMMNNAMWGMQQNPNFWNWGQGQQTSQQGGGMNPNWTGPVYNPQTGRYEF